MSPGSQGSWAGLVQLLQNWCPWVGTNLKACLDGAGTALTEKNVIVP